MLSARCERLLLFAKYCFEFCIKSVCRKKSRSKEEDRKYAKIYRGRYETGESLNFENSPATLKQRYFIHFYKLMPHCLF